MVPLTLLLHRILGGQGDTTEDNDDHDEGVKAGNGDNSVDENPNPVVSKIGSVIK